VNITKEVIYDFDTFMIHMETVINKYIQMPVGCTFLKGHRDPIYDRSNLDGYIKMGMVSDKPFHPVFAAAILRDVVLHTASEHNPHRELLYINKITGIRSDIYPGVYGSPEDIIVHYVPGITIPDAEKLLDYIKKALVPILIDIQNEPDYIYGICIATRYFKLIRHEDIRAFRYSEALQYMENNNNE